MELFNRVLIAIVIIFVTVIVLALPTMWLWNWLMPILFCIPKITFIQAIGVNALTAILFKNNSFTTQ